MIPNKKNPAATSGGAFVRNTKQRRVILEELKAVRSHPTADEILKMARGRIPNVSLATVYRNLDELAGAGHIIQLKDGKGQKRFDATLDEHYHARCVKCGRLEDLALKPIMALESAKKRIRGYEILGHSLEYYGICSKCRKTSDKK